MAPGLLLSAAMQLMMIRSVLVMVMAYVLAACGGGPCGDGLFGGSSSVAPAIPTLTVGVLVDSGNTLVIELVSTIDGACSPASSQTSRLVWAPALRTATATMAIPSSSARRVSGAMLGGGVTTWENVIPGLTLRARNNGVGGAVLTFTVDGASSTTLTCSDSASSCTPG
jgi:hypothetical protein